jgi:hypothetical protein
MLSSWAKHDHFDWFNQDKNNKQNQVKILKKLVFLKHIFIFRDN